MSAAFAAVMVAALIAWLICAVFAIRFARALWVWREREGRPHRWTDPAFDMVTVLEFLRGRPVGDLEQDALREHGRRMGTIAFACGLAFAALVGLAVVVAAVGGL